MVDCIVQEEYENRIRTVEKKLAIQRYKYDLVHRYSVDLENVKESLTKEITDIKRQAISLRAEFSHDVRRFLVQSFENESNRKSLKEAKMKLQYLSNMEKDLALSRKRIRDLERLSSIAQSSTDKPTDANIVAPPVAVVESSTASQTKTTPLVEEGNSSSTSTKSSIVPSAASAVAISSTSGVLVPGPLPVPIATIKRLAPSMKLWNLKDEHYLTIISFIEMTDILNVMLSCRHMCARIYKIFEIPFTDVVRSEWLMSIPVVQALDTSKTAAKSEESGLKPNEITSPVKSAVAPPAVPAPLTAIASTASGLLFPLFGGSSTPTPAVPSSTQNSNPSTFAEFVDQLTMKLSPQELKSILAMKEREQKSSIACREAQQQVADLQNQMKEMKDKFQVKLESTESSRNFLAQKIVEAERALKLSFDEVKQLKTQLSNDDKIITYLDNQQQELTIENRNMKTQYEHLIIAFEEQRNRVVELEEKLNFEMKERKVQFENSEANFKSQKKLLVKEVKTLRQSLQTLTAERDKLLSQVQLVRTAFFDEKYK